LSNRSNTTVTEKDTAATTAMVDGGEIGIAHISNAIVSTAPATKSTQDRGQHIILESVADFHRRAEDALGDRRFLDYVRWHAINLDDLGRFAGVCAVLPFVDCGSGRFDFTDSDGELLGFVCEVIGADGVMPVDLIAWPMDRPKDILSMFGRAAIVGEWEAVNPATYIFGRPLQVHRTPLQWIKAGCRGAAVVTPRLAARKFLDLPGPITGADREHSLQLAKMIRGFVGSQVVTPVGRAAA
jgi:hypothetical protein